MVEQLAEEYAGRVKIGGANTTDAGDTAAGLGVMSLPSLVFFKGGTEVHRIVGAVKKDKLVEAIAAKLDVRRS